MAQNVVINHVTYAEVPLVGFPKSGSNEDAVFYDTSSADIAAADIPVGKTGFNASGPVNGSMPVNGDVSGEIETKNGFVSIPAGKTSGGTVAIKASAVADLQSANLLSGKEVLGVPGSLTVPVIVQDSVTKALHIS